MDEDVLIHLPLELILRGLREPGRRIHQAEVSSPISLEEAGSPAWLRDRVGLRGLGPLREHEIPRLDGLLLLDLLLPLALVLDVLRREAVRGRGAAAGRQCSFVSASLSILTA